MLQKFTLLTVCFSLAMAAIAQPTLTSSANLPAAGESFTIYTESQLGSGVDAGSSGANVSWDFSSLSQQNSADKSYQFSSNSSYPDADLVSNFSGSNTYIGTANNSYTYFGLISGAAEINYTDGQNQVEFPLTYQDTYADSFSGTIDMFSQTFNREGTIEAVADAHGTLTTPAGTFNNVLRILIIRESEDFMNGTSTGTSLDSLYFWYNAQTAHPIMTMGKNYANGSFEGSFANFMAAGDVTVGTTSVQASKNFKIHPNPVNTNLTIKGEQEYQVQVYNLTGQLQTAFKATGSHFLDVADWNSGMYLLVIQQGDERMVQKVVVE